MDSINGLNPAMSYTNREVYQANLAKDAQSEQGQRALDLINSTTSSENQLRADLQSTRAAAPSVAYSDPSKMMSQANATPTVTPETPSASSGQHRTTDNLGQNINVNV